MKPLSFGHHQKPDRNRARTSEEALVEQIVAACTFKRAGEDRKLAKLLAITAKTAGWGTTGLHALYQKRLDPNVRNFTAFVWWSAKVRKKAPTTHPLRQPLP